MKVINEETRKVIKTWCMNPEEGAIDQAKNLANLPFLFKHVALMSDTHQGYGMPIGGVAAFENVVSPFCVGVDIGCGMQFVKTSFDAKDLDENIIRRIMGDIRKVIPVGFKKHDKMQSERAMPDKKHLPIKHSVVSEEYNNARKSLGTLGGGNHFIEAQETDDGKVGIMIHSGSRNLGKKIADQYNDIAVELNEKWYSSIPKEWQLAFLPLDSEEGQAYLTEMNYALEFAKCNRTLMMERSKQVLFDILPEIQFHDTVEIHHNFARMENHFGKNVMVHRKGATSAKDGELGIIPGSQGSASYLVRGKGNKDSFMSCSHGAGRQMGRKQAQRTLNLADEIKKLDDLGVIHAIRTVDDLDEAPSSYKDINVVMEEQEDLVDNVHELKPLGVIKG